MRQPGGQVIGSPLSAEDATVLARAGHHRQRATQLAERLRAVAHQRPEEALARHRGRGKLTVRQRLERLLDPDTAFLEVGALAAWGLYDQAVPGAGVVAGIGRVAGRECVVVANDATVKGGTYYPETVKKHLRAQQIALDNHLACIYLVDSGGVFLPLQAQVFADQDHFGRIFYNQAQLSARGIPQLAAVMGMCTAGGAYVPAMSDENIIVEGTGTVYLAGPPLVHAATGEVVDAQALGGGAMHARTSGVVDHLVRSDEEALQRMRDAVANLGGGRKRLDCEVRAPEPPLYPPEEIYGLLPVRPQEPCDTHAVLARLLDGSRLHAFKAEYGPTLICGWAHWQGYPVGIVANHGVLFGAAAQKGAHFVQMCGQRGVPLIFLHDIPGFMVGRQVEEAGIIKDGAKMVQAVATCGVPCIAVIAGASNGAGNYAMCGRGFCPRFVFAWPSARVAVMGPQQAARVLVQLKSEAARAAGAPLSEAAAGRLGAPIAAQLEAESDPYFATARLWDDGIIDPAHTREVVGLALSACLNAPIARQRAPVFRQ